MFKTVLSLVLALFLFSVEGVTPAHADLTKEKETRFAEKVKEGISKLGTGAEARIEVKLRDTTKLKGYIVEASDESFVIADEKTSSTCRVAYSQVKQVKGNNLSKSAKIAIGVGVILLPIMVALFFASKG